jgi:hypothetical protein
MNENGEGNVIIFSPSYLHPNKLGINCGGNPEIVEMTSFRPKSK